MRGDEGEKIESEVGTVELLMVLVTKCQEITRACSTFDENSFMRVKRVKIESYRG